MFIPLTEIMSTLQIRFVIWTHPSYFLQEIWTVLLIHCFRSISEGISSDKAKASSLFMQQNHNVDPWRFLNPLAWQFCFFYHVHHSFSSVCYFFIDSSFIPMVRQIGYTAILMSDLYLKMFSNTQGYTWAALSYLCLKLTICLKWPVEGWFWETV